MDKIRRLIKGFFEFLGALIQSRYMISQLAARDFKNKYLGSYLGLPWAFIQPLMTIGVMWFVVEVGFKPGNIYGDVPFGIWFVVGYVPWLFISDAIMSTSGSMMEYAFLLKNLNFRPSIIPIIKIITAFIIHLFFIGLCVVFSLSYGYKPSFIWVQVFYFAFASVCLVVSIAWLISALNVFIRDIGQFVAVIMQLAFWGTPIIWSINMLSPKTQTLFKLNPFYYLILGYRDTFINGVWFFQRYKYMAYYWVVTFVFFFVGAVIFKKLKPHFTDVI